MNTFVRSAEFDSWLTALRDTKGKARILARLATASLGNFGDCKSVGGHVMEMRIDFGPGYRVYYTRRGGAIYLLLLAGDKDSQARDTRRAHRMVADLED